MDRRAFLAALCGALPVAAIGQRSRIPKVGYLLVQPVSEPPSAERKAFIEGLTELGYVPGRTIEIVYASAQNEPDFLDDVVRDLVKKNPDVIVASGAIAVLAAKRATTRIPIVALALGDPVGVGAVGSLGRPDGNITGVSFISSDLAGKRVQLIAELLPKARRIAVLLDSRNPNSVAEANATVAAIKGLGLTVSQYNVESGKDLPKTLTEIGKVLPDALYVVFEGGTVAANRTAIADFGLRNRVPVVSGWSPLTDAGGLISYAPNIPLLFRRSASYVQRILQGAAPGDLPFEQATTVEMVVNVKTAKALGVTIPQSLLLRADRIVR